MRTTLLFLTVVACDSNSIGTNNLNDMAALQGDMAVLPDQGAMSCDPIAQDCPSGQKCAVTGGGMTTMPMPICVMAGTVADGQPCTRTMGADDCAAGLTCARSAGGTMGICRKYCTMDNQCDSGQKCAAGRFGQSIVGTCTPACTPFGNDCAGGTNCSTPVASFGSTTNGFFTCRTPGTAGPFEDCGGGVTCAANEFCDNTQMWCAPLCDDTHACPPTSGDGGVGVSCMVVEASGANPGICGP
jgi:hypothetical protein